MSDDMQFSESATTSLDGTRVGYRRIGRGPGLVLVQGAMGTAYNYEQLARALAEHFTVYTPDRRGRGMSLRPYSPEHVIQRDVEDLDAVLENTDASSVFGLSSGAMITLEAARTLPRVTRAAVYEPPFYAKGIAHSMIERFNESIAREDLAGALAIAGKIVGLAPLPIRLMPVSMAKLLTGLLLRNEAAKGTGPYAPLRTLLPSMRYDFRIVGDMDGKTDTFRSVNIPVLLLSGTKSPAYLQQSVVALGKRLPNARHVSLEGLDHSAPWNTDRGGAPDRVAQALRDFF